MQKKRKLSEARVAKLLRVHLRDCLALRDIEFQPCLRCIELKEIQHEYKQQKDH